MVKTITLLLMFLYVVFMSMKLFIVMISTVIVMYTEIRSTRCVAQSYPFVYPPAQRLYLEQDDNVKLYQDGTKKSKMHITHHRFGIGSGLRLKKPMAGHIYCIMRRTRHQYHYAVRRAKRRTTETIRTKLAENMTNSTDFWR